MENAKGATLEIIPRGSCIRYMKKWHSEVVKTISDRILFWSIEEAINSVAEHHGTF